jgi:hypothetical protein
MKREEGSQKGVFYTRSPAAHMASFSSDFREGGRTYSRFDPDLFPLLPKVLMKAMDSCFEMSQPNNPSAGVVLLWDRSRSCRRHQLGSLCFWCTEGGAGHRFQHPLFFRVK